MDKAAQQNRFSQIANQAPELVLDTHSVEQTIQVGAALGRACQPNDVIALTGPLGAGKTHLVKGIAEGLGITDRGRVTSPTFVLEQEYAGRLLLRHLDAYRLSSPHELWDIGIDEMCKAGGVVIVEWADRAREALPQDTLWVMLEPVGADDRRLRIAATGPQSANLLERLRKTVDAQGH